MSEKLILKFDPNTIEHLGISLYSQLPNVLSELVSNSWDADADNTTIEFIDNSIGKEIIYTDDGTGMNFDELNNKYLLIGRNRRSEINENESLKGRKFIGKKGLGKLSVFGICNIVEVISVKDGIKNHFSMDIEKIKESKGGIYSPELLIEKNFITSEKNGTIIKLKKIRRRSPFDLKNISVSLSKKFLIFDKMKVSLIEKDKSNIEITNELKFSGLNEEFEWIFPNIKYGEDYEFWKEVKGKIFTTVTPIKDTDLSGIYLTSRGKIVNNASFYDLRDNDHYHTYVTGYLEVDFIDDFNEDVISTDRNSLNWENDKTRDLRDYLQIIIRKIGNEWKLKRSDRKSSIIKEEKSIDIKEWQRTLPTFEKDLSDKIINPILENSNIDIEESSKLIGNIIDKFENKTFKDYASKIADISKPEDIPMLLKLMDDWKSIESKQYRDLAITRIEVIKQFEDYINTNTKEVPTLHNFLKKFSWLLDPRILEFRDEITYTKLLKETYPEDKLDLQDRRIDFLCSNALGEILYVIEIKRSNFKVNKESLEQAYEYGAFLKDKYSSVSGFSKVVCYVVGGEKSGDNLYKNKEKTYALSGEVFVKTYRELLEQSKEYHKEFIEAYNSFTEK